MVAGLVSVSILTNQARDIRSCSFAKVAICSQKGIQMVGQSLVATHQACQSLNIVGNQECVLPGVTLCIIASLTIGRFMPNVLGFLGGLDNPTPVRQADINRILGTAEDITIKSEDVAIPFTVDEAVKVTDGPFNGFSGIVEEVNAEKRKLKVMVKIFGRKTPLELSYDQVEKE